MTRAEAIAILYARMSDAPNIRDYVAWLDRQPDETLVALATGQPVHCLPRVQAVA